MSGLAGLTVDGHLSNYAEGYVQDRERSVATHLAPIVPSDGATGDFTKFDGKNSFIVYDAKRATGSNPKKVEFKGSKGTFSCEEFGLGQFIDPKELRRTRNLIRLRERKTASLLDNTLTAHESSVITTCKAAVASTAAAWSTDTNDPIKTIQSGATAIYNATGRYPNAIACSFAAWIIIQNNAKVKANMPGASVAALTAEILVQMLNIPGLRPENVVIGTMPIDTNALGKEKNAAEGLGSEFWLFLKSNNPELDDPSFAKTFEAPDSSLTGIVTWREGVIEHFATLWAVDTQVVAAGSAKRWAVS